jgi:hypothetical protein
MSKAICKNAIIDYITHANSPCDSSEQASEMLSYMMRYEGSNKSAQQALEEIKNAIEWIADTIDDFEV